jgi:uncharacterized membrane protein
MYLLCKTLHVLSATALLGTGMGIAFFCWFGSRAALRAGDIGALRVVLRYTVAADAVFTAPAVVLQLGSGAVLLNLNGWSWVSAWSLTVIGLFIFIGACWLPVVWIQLRLKRLAETAPMIAALPRAFAVLFRAWFLLGIPAFASVITMVFLMVAKPLPVV